MKKEFNFSKCVEHIEQLKEDILFSKRSGIEARDLLRQKSPKDKLLIASQGTQDILLVYTRKCFRALYFKEGRFEKEKEFKTIDEFLVEKYKIVGYRIMVNEFLEWLESSRFFDEEVALTSKEVEILEKYGVKVPKERKTTRRYLKEAYEETVLADSSPKTDAGPVKEIVGKYTTPKKKGKQKPGEQTFTLRLKKTAKEEVVEIPEEHSQVFTRYGIDVPQKSTFREFRKVVEKKEMPTEVLKVISEADMEIFLKYGITFTPTGEVRGRVRLPRTAGGWFKAIGSTLLFLLLVVGMLWYFMGEAFEVWVQNFLYIQKEKVACMKILQNLRPYKMSLEQKSGPVQKLIQELAKEYPGEEDYIEASPRLVQWANTAKAEIDRLEKAISEAQKLLDQKKYSDAFALMKEYENYVVDRRRILDILQRVCEKLQTIRQFNEQVKRELVRENKIFQTIRSLRNYSLLANEYLDSIAEKMAIREDRYRDDKDRIVLPLDYPAQIERARNKVFQVEQAIGQADAILQAQVGEKDRYQKLEDLLKPYWNDAFSNLREMKDIEEILVDNMKALEKLRTSRVTKEDVAFFENTVGRYLSQLKKQSESLKRDLEEAKNLPPEFQAPSLKAIEETYRKSVEETEIFQAELEKSRQFLSGNDWTRAKEVLSPLASKERQSFQEKMAEAMDELSSILQKAEVFKVEQSERARKFADLHVASKRLFDSMKLHTLNAERQIVGISQSLAQDKLISEKMEECRKQREKTVAMQVQIQKALETVDTKLHAQGVQDAYDFLDSRRNELKEAQKSYQDLRTIYEDLGALAASVAKRMEEEKKIERTRMVLSKIDRYVSQLENVLGGLEGTAKGLSRDYPPSQGYPELSRESRQFMENLRKQLDSLKSRSASSVQLLKNKQIEKAWEMVAMYEGQKISADDLEQKLKALDAELQDKLYKSKLMKAGKEKGAKVIEYLTELKTRRDGLREVLPRLKKNFSTLAAKHPDLQKVGGLHPETAKYIKDGEAEERELDNVIARGESLLKEEKYRAATDLLSPYSNSVNVGISILPALKQMDLIAQRAVGELNDPQKKAELEKRIQEEKARQERLKSLLRSPGSWYPQVAMPIQQYENMKEQIGKSLQNEGSRYLYSAIENTVGKIKEYKREIAELDYLIEMARSSGKELPDNLPPHRQKPLNDYLSTRNIQLDVAEEISGLQSGVEKLQEEIRMGDWVEKDTLNGFLQRLKSVDRKYEEYYLYIRKPVENAVGLIPE